jgi:hypothetical protein
MTFFLAMLLATAEPSLAAIAEPAGGTVGFAAVELATGRMLGLNRDQPFPMQSVFKLPIAIEVLHQVDAGKIALAQEIQLVAGDAREGATGTVVVPSQTTVRKLLEAMVVNSDNVACDKLLALVGGPQAVDARMRGLGIEGMTIRFSEREMTAGKGDNTATPAAMVALLGAMARKGSDFFRQAPRSLMSCCFKSVPVPSVSRAHFHPARLSPTRLEPRAPKTARLTPPTTLASSRCRTGAKSPSRSSFTTPRPTSQRARRPSPSWRAPRTTPFLHRRCMRRFPVGYRVAGGETPPMATAS